MHRFLIKDPTVGWVSVESENYIPRDDRAWRAKLDETIQMMKFKEMYSFSMEFKGEHYLAMIRPGMENHSERTDEAHKYDYKHNAVHSYSKHFFPQSDLDSKDLLKFVS